MATTETKSDPLFHGTKWSAHDRTCLVREVLAGGDWPARAATRLGRTPGSVMREARRMIEQGPVPDGFRAAVAAAREAMEPRREPRDAKAPAERERLRRSFATFTAARDVLAPMPEQRAYSVGCDAGSAYERDRLTRDGAVLFRGPKWAARVLRGLGVIRDVD